VYRYRGILLALNSLGVPRRECYGGRCRHSLFLLIFGKWRFEFELSPGQRAAMFFFDRQCSGTTGPKGSNPDPKPKRSTQPGCLC
jgi:hypothetical protein